MEKSTKYISLSPHGRCAACWDCVGACPKGVLKKMNLIVHKHAIVGSNSSACIGCFKCVKVYKHDVIRKNKPRLISPVFCVRICHFCQKRRVQGTK